MTIVLVGLNHRTAPVDVREQLALTGCALQMALAELQVDSRSTAEDNSSGLREHVILSTCNRLEIYVETSSAAYGWERITRFLSRLQNIPLDILTQHLYLLEGEAVVEHLLRVAAGLDSMILGEAQILGQVTQAFNDAHAAGTTGAVLSHLFAQAANTGKRAHSETHIGRHTTSVSHTAAQLVQQKGVEIARARLLVIGAGEMAVLAAQAMQRHGGRDFTFINRTHSRAQTLAQQFGGRALNWHQLHEALVWADVVLSATGAPHTVLYAADVAAALTERENRPLLLVDIAVPRDIEEAVEALPNVERCDIDALQAAVDQHLAQRMAAIPHVEAIIGEAKSAFFAWLNSRRVVPVITHLQQWARELAEREVNEAMGRLRGADVQTEQVMNRLAHRLVNKLLHEPTVRLKRHAADGDGAGYAVALEDLFGLMTAEEAARLYCEERQAACAEKRPCTLECIAASKKA